MYLSYIFSGGNNISGGRKCWKEFGNGQEGDGRGGGGGLVLSPNTAIVNNTGSSL